MKEGSLTGSLRTVSSRLEKKPKKPQIEGSFLCSRGLKDGLRLLFVALVQADLGNVVHAAH